MAIKNLDGALDALIEDTMDDIFITGGPFVYSGYEQNTLEMYARDLWAEKAVSYFPDLPDGAWDDSCKDALLRQFGASVSDAVRLFGSENFRNQPRGSW